jgi:hypothetical protein
MRHFAATSFVFVAVTFIGGTGCNDGKDLFGLGIGEEADDAGQVTPAAVDGAQACPPGQVEVPGVDEDAGAAAETLDPAKLPACAPVCGGAHCVPTDKVPEASRPFFATCATGYCLPDALIRSGGAKPPSCTSLGAAPGVCLSTCVPLVAENQDILPKTGCAEDERCAPCTNPNDNKPTGACAIGTQKSAPAKRCVMKEESQTGTTGTTDAGPVAPPACPHVGAPVIVASTLPACGAANSGAHCMPEKNVPTALAPQLSTCGTNGRCVPDKLIESGGRFVPKTCASVLGAEGRCQNMAVPSVAAQATLPVDVCDANERCVPCFSPLDGTPTGACTTSCDPGPKQPAKLFPSCCGGEGKCVPTSLVPQEQRASLYACAQDSLCVPTEHLNPAFVPQKCSGEVFFDDYDGVCLSDRCLDLGSTAWLLDDGNCPNGKTCVPCHQNGRPTGAPGCAP